MLKQSLLLVLLLTPAVPATQAQSTGGDQLTVKVTGLRSSNGKVRIELFNSAKGFPKEDANALQSVWIDASQAQQGTIQTTFKDLPSGDYAVLTFHDENGNGILDRGAFGRPKEGFAVSNNATGHPPSFDASKFSLTASEQSVSLTLHY
ncbi:DUF2141 domain-containing protein [Tunturibacter empetritectus]|uniref:DUF2141 domain-containing protein n=1 Tax=Tunturiibacter empetritectus TaxID=3069691 RepID=A0AAU7ZGQ0_9BACT